MDNISIQGSTRIESRPLFVRLASWHVVEIEMNEWEKDGNPRHLLVAVIMACVALEAFLNDIVEFYRGEDLVKIDRITNTKNRLRAAVQALDPSLTASAIEGWLQICELISLRNNLVHNKVTSEITENGTVTQRNKYELNWRNADKNILGVKTFVLSLKKKLRWDDAMLEGQRLPMVQQRFNHFFDTFKSAKDLEAEAGL